MKTSAQLAAMRHVLERPEEADDTPLKKKNRQWFIEDFTGFMRSKVRLEESHLNRRTTREQARAKKRAESESADPTDEGTEKAITVLEKWLEDYQREHPEGYQKENPC